MNEAERRGLEETIRQIRDVLSCRVVTEESGTIEEVHVLAHSSRSPKQVVRDVESACMAQHGIRLDHRKISVAQLRGEDDEAYAVARIRLSRIAVTVADPMLSVDVELKFKDSVAVGREEGPGSGESRLRFPAAAALHAVEELLHATCSLVLEDAACVNTRKGRIAMVLMSLVTLTEEEPLFGVSLVRRDEGEAIVRAALHAVNRRVQITVGGR